MEILSKLFGNAEKVKLMRLFLFNPDAAYSAKEAADRAKISTSDTAKELRALMVLGIIRGREVVRELPIKGKNKKSPGKKANVTVFGLNAKFAYLAALKNLLITASLRADETLIRKFAKSGKLKLLFASGVFLPEWDPRAAVLIV